MGPTDPNEPQAPQTLEEQLFVTIAESNLLVGPGWFFSTKQEEEVYIDASDFSGEGRRIVNGLLRGDDPSGSPDDHDPAQYAHFRLAFSMATVSLRLLDGVDSFLTRFVPFTERANEDCHANHVEGSAQLLQTKLLERISLPDSLCTYLSDLLDLFIHGY